MSERGAARAKAQPSGTSSGNSADLIERVAHNTATMAEKDLFDQKLHDDAKFRQEALRRQVEYHVAGQLACSDRLRALFSRMLLAQRSRFPANEREPPKSGGRSDQAEAARGAFAQSEDEALNEMINRVVAGTASKSQKQAFIHQVMGSEVVFEQVNKLQHLFELEPSKSAQDKAKRLARILRDCNESLLEMHKAAAAVNETNLARATLGSSPLGGTAARGSPSGGSPLRGNVTGGSAAAGNSQPRRSPAEEGASAIKLPDPFSRAVRAKTSSLSRAGSQGPENNPDQVQEKGTSARDAAAAVPEVPAGLTTTLDQMRLEQQPQIVQHSDRSGSSAKTAASGNPKKKSKKGKSKK